MYKVTVPINALHLENSDLSHVLESLERLDAERVFLCGVSPYETDRAKRDRGNEIIKKYCEFFKGHGYEVGVWIWSFWINGENNFLEMKSNSGIRSKGFICPSDEKFRRFAAEYVREFAQCGVDLIQFDDDFRYGHLGGGFCCICENHLTWVINDLGEEITEEFLTEKITKGGPNRYRDSWLRANGYYMELFAKEMREAVDSVNPNIRMGRCTCMTAWDMDGTDPERIGRLLAGNTKPFVRLIGAPYWAVKMAWGNRLQDVIELHRMERSWFTDADFEIFAEGDAWPRPRWNCPAAYLEGFDTALRADGILDGILKYAIDYTSGIDYEQGYIKRHQHNKKLYEEIRENFADKTAVGIRVYESAKKYAQTVIPKKIEGTHEIQDYFNSPAIRFLAGSAIPTTYYGDGICGICFGENARHLPDSALSKGLILDACAAKILTEKGIDVGIREVLGCETTKEEYYIDENEYVSIVYDTDVYRMNLSDKAVVKSEFIPKSSNAGLESGFRENVKRIPGSYIYENANGQRFFVYTFDSHYNQETLWRNYIRGVQIEKAARWLSGESLPAVCHNNPDLYMMCKEGNEKLAVGLWNFCADSILEPELTLSKEYENIKFINCKGNMAGNKVYLSEISPFGFAGIVLK